MLLLNMQVCVDSKSSWHTDLVNKYYLSFHYCYQKEQFPDNPYYPFVYQRLHFVRFREKQNKTVSGISENARKKRKNRNLVTMKFNLLNWLLEIISTLMVLIDINRFFTLLYVVVGSCGTPLVYFIGIEENRKCVQEYFKLSIRISKRNKELMKK